MAVLRKAFALPPALQGYGGGPGLTENTQDNRGVDFSDIVPGAQIAVGARYARGGTTSVFGEVKHQVGLDAAGLPPPVGMGQSYATTNLLVGLSFGV